MQPVEALLVAAEDALLAADRCQGGVEANVIGVGQIRRRSDSEMLLGDPGAR